MSIESWISIGMAASSILAATGSLSVLFYRVRKLESDVHEMRRKLRDNQEELHEIKEILASIKADISWIKDWAGK